MYAPAMYHCQMCALHAPLRRVGDSKLPPLMLQARDLIFAEAFAVMTTMGLWRCANIQDMMGTVWPMPISKAFLGAAPKDFVVELCSLICAHTLFVSGGYVGTWQSLICQGGRTDGFIDIRLYVLYVWFTWVEHLACFALEYLWVYSTCVAELSLVLLWRALIGHFGWLFLLTWHICLLRTSKWIVDVKPCWVRHLGVKCIVTALFSMYVAVISNNRYQGQSYCRLMLAIGVHKWPQSATRM